MLHTVRRQVFEEASTRDRVALAQRRQEIQANVCVRRAAMFAEPEGLEAAEAW